VTRPGPPRDSPALTVARVAAGDADGPDRK
jgi:hypothetical protein